MKRIRSVPKFRAVLGVALVSIGLLLTPGLASAKDHGSKGNPWHGNGSHDNGNHYGWYKKSNPQYPHGYNRPRNYEYYQGHRGYWDNNQNGIRIFINL